MAEYYRQRAGSGLIVTEGTSPSPNGLGYARIPGLFTLQQVDGWRQVTDAVHGAGGRIFVQLMHCGRVCHLDNMPAGAEVLAPSVVPFGGKMWTDGQGERPCSPPRAMTEEDIRKATGEYVRAAQLAMEAGFDGVELHGANGYLIDQFLNAGSNRRDDAYGGSTSQRNRFALEIAAAVTKAIGAQRTGIRLSPHGVFNEMIGFDGTTEQYGALAAGLGGLGLAYVHLVDHSAMGAPQPLPVTVEAIRSSFRTAGGGSIILSGGYDSTRAEADLQSGAADLVAFGRPHIANPDLAQRLRYGAPLALPEPATFYTPGTTGYTDYPTWPGVSLR
jgi:N-ethylmaleimide reductase